MLTRGQANLYSLCRAVENRERRLVEILRRRRFLFRQYLLLLPWFLAGDVLLS